MISIMIKYVALLRGINVGGKTIRMGDLKTVFDSLGFTEIKTVLASGNVVFSSKETDTVLLTKEIEQALAKTFGFSVSVTIRTADYIVELVKPNPFKSITVTPDVRLYVTFLKENTKSTLVIPYESPRKDFQIISITSDELFSILFLGAKTTDIMEFLDKKFGKTVTTRNWNTVKKISMLKKL